MPRHAPCNRLAFMKHSTFAVALLTLTVAACGGPEEPPLEVVSDAIQAPADEGLTEGTATSTDTVDWAAIYEILLNSIWEDVCQSMDIIRDAGVYAFCEAYLDANGYPESGLRRTIARSVCINKVNKAIDDAVCAITDVFTSTAAAEDGGGN